MNTFEVIALYRDENKAKAILGTGKTFYEILISMCDEKSTDKIIVNPRCLTVNSLPYKEDYKKLIISGSTILHDYLGSEGEKLTVLSPKSLLSKEESEKLSEHLKSDGYSSVCMIDAYNVDYENSTDELSTISKIKSSALDAESFIREYETPYLRNHRVYKKQRKDYIPWDEYFMAIAKLTSLRSKDPSTQVGACIVGDDKRILSVGYNGAPLGIDDDIFPWERKGDPLHTKYMYVCHAEMNAILNYRGSRKDFEGATVYVDLFPCNECAKMIIQSGIKKVIYLSDKYANSDGTIASKRLFDLAGVEYTCLNEEYQDTITLSLNPSDK